jgi:thioredoxin 1
MSWLMIILMAAAAFLILLPMLTYLSARRMLGSRVDDAAQGAGAGDRLIYFYSPRCAPCRSMTPIIDQLAQESDRVIKVDVQQDQETARAFNIRATPTTLLIKENRILDVVLGAKSRKQIENLIKRVA